MASNLYVNVTGPALSILIYENVRCIGDQEGLLIGEVIHHVTRSISDSQMQNEKTDIIISINSLIPFPETLQFYNGIGRINKEELKKSLINLNAEVVGWYSFRRSVHLTPHLRDKLFHKELTTALSHMTPEHVVMCLLNSSIGSGGSTHIFNHKFIRYRFKAFEAIPMQVHNLGETHQSEYKLNPSTTSLSNSFNKIVKSALDANRDAVDKSDANLVCHIQRTLQEHLRYLINDVSASEENILLLEKEIDILKQQLAPIPNDKPTLMPKILHEENNITEQKASPSPTSTEKPICNDQLVSSTTSWVAKELNNSKSIKQNERENSSAPLPQPDPFSYVTDLKQEMIHSTPVRMSSEGENVNSSSPTRRGRSASRGMSRGMSRGSRVGANQGSRESFPNLQTTPSSTPKSSHTKPSPTSAGSGYAQALKKPTSQPEDVTASLKKPVTRSHAACTNGPEPSQNL